jgi:hypothetical protein
MRVPGAEQQPAALRARAGPRPARFRGDLVALRERGCWRRAGSRSRRPWHRRDGPAAARSLPAAGRSSSARWHHPQRAGAVTGCRKRPGGRPAAPRGARRKRSALNDRHHRVGTLQPRQHHEVEGRQSARAPAVRFRWRAQALRVVHHVDDRRHARLAGALEQALIARQQACGMRGSEGSPGRCPGHAGQPVDTVRDALTQRLAEWRAPT